ncbi:collagen alpha-1(X) chain-like [Pristis pectinata]|uniref:collagen alpha-1(X) chain-like n=1 Tax=Pristis pectinata TaxID=685728 RepID=UPI00223D9C02|nr:collagen alpha-1(X) chain-like [Pristis pectinata]
MCRDPQEMVAMDFWVKTVLLILSASMSTDAIYKSHQKGSAHDKNNTDHHQGWQDLLARITELEHHVEHDTHDDHHAVLFAASRGPDNNAPETGIPIVFDRVLLNREGAYDPDNGIFTCPDAGTYFFSFSFLPGLEAGETTVALVKNGDVHERLYSLLPADATQLSERSCLLHLEEGDQVWVTLEKGSVLIHQASLSFQGYRISK